MADVNVVFKAIAQQSCADLSSAQKGISQDGLTDFPSQVQKGIEINSHKPEWFKIRPPSEKYEDVKATIRKYGLTTICVEGKCPNLSECWSGGTATFMVMGDTCTRGCRFCNVKTAAKGLPLDKDEPKKLVAALKEMNALDTALPSYARLNEMNEETELRGMSLTKSSPHEAFGRHLTWPQRFQLRQKKELSDGKANVFDYIVITSVDRDDLPDQGSNHFAECVRAVKKEFPDLIVEVLIPDFRGNIELLKNVVDAKPDVISHNVETVERLQRKVRDIRANYKQSLVILEAVKKLNPKIITKSAIMVGLGETKEEIIQTMKDLRKIGVEIFTIGQYLRPSQKHLKIEEWIRPEVFAEYKKEGEKSGFVGVFSGPFVRSSYKAGEVFIKNFLNNKEEELKITKNAQKNRS